MERLVTGLAELVARDQDWEPLRPGVDAIWLAGNRDTAPSAAVLRYQPGARVPTHRHTGFEIIHVLSGTQSDERGTYPAGRLIVNPQGIEHSVWSDTGCLVLVMWERSIEWL